MGGVGVLVLVDDHKLVSGPNLLQHKGICPQQPGRCPDQLRGVVRRGLAQCRYLCVLLGELRGRYPVVSLVAATELGELAWGDSALDRALHEVAQLLREAASEQCGM